MTHKLAANPHNTITIDIQGPRGFGKTYLIKKISQLFADANFEHSIVLVQADGQVRLEGGHKCNPARPVQFPIMAAQALIIEDTEIKDEPVEKVQVAAQPPMEATEDRMLRNVALDYAVRTCGESTAQSTIDVANAYYKFLVG